MRTGSRPLTRRQFIYLTGMAGAGLAVAACVPAGAPQAGQASPAMPMTNEYVIKHPIIQDPQGVDPNNPLTPPNKTMGTMYHDGLYRLTRTGIEPNLATAPPAIENEGRRWTIPLRAGVKFHNGEAFTAADVKYSLDFIKENALSTSSLLVNIENVSVQDDLTVVIDLVAPDSFLLSAMSVTDGPRIVAAGAYDGAPVEKEGLQTALTSAVPGVTTGPYELIEYSVEERVVLKRFDDYWGWDLFWGGFSESIPKYLVFEVVNDPTVRVSQLLAQAQDWNYNVSPTLQARIEETEGLNSIPVADPFINYLAFVGEGVLGFTEQGIHNRKAISAAMDRVDINNVVNAGLGSPAFSFWYADDPLVNQEVEKIHSLHADLDAAREHLKLAGNADGFSAHIVLAEGRGYEKPASIIQEQVAKVGIDLTVEANVSSANWPRVIDNEVDGVYHDAGDSGIWVVEYGRYYAPPYGISPWHMDDMPEEWLDRFMGAMQRMREAPPGSEEYADAVRNVQFVNADLAIHVPVVHGARLEAYWDYLEGVESSPTITPIIHGVTVAETENGPPERDTPM